MRILYCNKYNFQFSGTESYIFSAMGMMRQRGHEIALFSMADPRGEPTPYDHCFVEHRDFQNSKGIATRARLAAHAIYSVEARRKLRALIREFRPDVAHVRNIYHHLSPSIFWELKAHGIPVLYHVNDFKLLCPTYNMVSRGKPCERCKRGAFANAVIEGCYRGGRPATIVLALEAYLHRWIRTYENCVDLVLAPSEFVKRKLIESGWNPERIGVLPHFQEAPRDTQPHPASSRIALYFGRLSEEKGIKDLLSAAGYLPDIQVLIAGEGPLRAALEAEGKRERLMNVWFVGQLTGPALQNLIAQSQFTIFPSRAYETFGKSILESYAQARAVIASDLGSRRELVHNGETGILYRPGDSGELASAMRTLVQNPQLSHRMGENGLRLIRERYSPTRHFEALTGIYESLKKRATRAATPRGNAKPLRVAFIGGRGIIGKYSGVESFYEKAGRGLASRGYEVTAYCRTYFTPDQKEYAGIKIVRLPTIRSKHLDTFVHSLLSTIHACFSHYDIVHYHTLGPSVFAFLPRLFGKETLVTVQGLDWQRKKWSWFARLVLQAGEWTSAHFPDRTIVVSRTLQNYYLSRYGRPVSYVPNGTDLLSRRTGPCFTRFGLQPESYVLFLGRFSPEKNLDLLVDVFEQIDTPMKLILAGGSSHSDEYMTRLRSHENGKIRFLDWLSGDTLEEILTNAALFVLPSDLEGLSLALLDAMAAGVCVLASDVPENREAIGDAGFTFRAGNPLDFRRMLASLLLNPDLRRSTAQRAQERVKAQFLWTRVVDDLERVYSDVVGKRPRAVELPVARKAA